MPLKAAQAQEKMSPNKEGDKKKVVQTDQPRRAQGIREVGSRDAVEVKRAGNKIPEKEQNEPREKCEMGLERGGEQF